MKRLIILIYFLGGLIACEKDELIVPFEEKNWYFIEYRDNMDEVDQKIYDIYQKFGVAIFYHDTIGVEDRGWRDKNGNINYYYEILKINYDPVDGPSGTQYELPDVSTLEKKKELLPILNVIEEFLLPAISSIDYYLPCILLVDYLTYGNYLKYSAKRSFNFMVVAKEFESSESAIPLDHQINEFLMEFLYNGLVASLETFYELIYISMTPLNIPEHYKNNPWGNHYSNYNISFNMHIAFYKSYLYALDIRNQRDELQAYIQTLDPDSDESKELMPELVRLNSIYDVVVGDILMWEDWGVGAMAEPTVKDLHNYGFLGYSPGLGDGLSHLPIKAEDLLMYFNLVLSSTRDEVYDKWGDYVYITYRYEAIYAVMDAMMDIDEVAKIVNSIK